MMSRSISDVLLVTKVQPMLLHTMPTVPELLTLAAGNAIAGNLFILGAAHAGPEGCLLARVQLSVTE
jgi:hypothetical protein